jgi:hypothetical protein
MNTQKINKILKIIILLSLALLLFLILTIKLDNCDLCKFEYMGQNMTTNKFTGYFFVECINKNLDTLFNFSNNNFNLSNLTKEK